MNEIMANPLTALPIIHAVAKRAQDIERDVRRAADAIVKGDYRDKGTTQLAVKVGEAKVGTLSVAVKSAHPEVVDEEAFAAFCAQRYGDGATEEFLDLSAMTEGDKTAIMAWAKRTKRGHLVGRRYRMDGVDPRLVLDSLKGCRTDGGWSAMTPDGVVADGVEWVPESVGSTTLRGCKPDDVIEAAALNRIDPFAEVAGLLGGSDE